MKKEEIDSIGHFNFCYPSADHSELHTTRHPLTEQQTSVRNLYRMGWNIKQIGKRCNMSASSVHDALTKIRHWGYPL